MLILNSWFEYLINAKFVNTYCAASITSKINKSNEKSSVAADKHKHYHKITQKKNQQTQVFKSCKLVVLK